MDHEELLDVELDHEALQYLIDYGYLEGAAEGITRLVIAEGESVLSQKQHDVFDDFVKRPYFSQTCRRCQCPIPGSERIGSWENNGMCSWCIKLSSKED